MSLFDIVIPVGPNDLEMVQVSINYTKNNIIGYRNIYLISYKDNLLIEDCIIISEQIFPFIMKDIDDIFGLNIRNGWYLQQLLKLYAGNIIPGILSRYLVIDADVCFLKPTEFITKNNSCIYTTGTEFHEPYFFHMNRLHPSFNKVHPLSGISHHMLFETKIINEIFKTVEEYYKNEKQFWYIFLEQVDNIHRNGSGASEYELYFTYNYLNHNEKIHIRELKWENRSNIDNLLNIDLDYVSIHWHSRDNFK
jgi:hypothetical protein